VARDPARRRHAGPDDGVMTEGFALPRRLNFGQAWPAHRPCSRGRIAATAASAWPARRSARVRVLNLAAEAARPWEARMTRPETSPLVWAMRCLRAQKCCPGWSPLRGEDGSAAHWATCHWLRRGHASTLTLSAPTDREAPGREEAPVHPERVCTGGRRRRCRVGRDARISRSPTLGCWDQSMVMEYRSTKDGGGIRVDNAGSANQQFESSLPALP
jgi:hypothetical protein